MLRSLGIFRFVLRFSESRQFTQILLLFIPLSQQAVITLNVYVCFNVYRGVEIVKFSTCPGTSKKPKCTCPQKILLVQNNKLAYTLQCLNNLFIQKQYETRYISTLVISMDPDQLASLVNSVDPDQLASPVNSLDPDLKKPADQDPHCFQCKM